MRVWSIVAAGVVALAMTPSCTGGASTAATSTDGGGAATADGSIPDAQGPGSDGSSTSVGSPEAGASSEGGATTCIGSSFLGALGKDHLLVGGSMAAATAASAPFDLQYVYISGGLADGAGPCASCATGCTTNGTTCANSGPGCAWWGCWQSDSDAPGDYARTFASTCAAASPAQIPMLTYYQLLQSSGVTEGAPEVTQAATNATFMARYFADWRFLLQQIGQGVALLHVEPDFWGYAEQQNEDPTSLSAAVASANATDCGGSPNTIAGMGQCMIGMVRKYAPHAFVALHASAWGTNVDAAGNTNPTLDVAAVAQKTAKFLAACGEASADFVVVETSDRDAGYYQVVESKNTWWDATNAALPDFHQDFAYVTALTEALNKAALYWQTPYGNTSLNNTTGQYQDNRVDYFFAHMNELAAAHAVGAAFGAGATGCTTAESDSGHFVTKAKAYYAAGAQGLCP
jgi:hypothetical protein